MDSISQCFFYKFEHCKYAKEVCDDDNCDTQQCIKRHPRTCKFFKEFKRCKFNQYCSYSHANEDVKSEVAELKSKINAMEIQSLEKDREITGLKETITQVKDEMKLIKTETLETVLEMAKTLLAEATKGVIDTLVHRQDEFEKSDNDQLNKVEAAAATLLQQLAPTHLSRSSLPKDNSKPKQQDCSSCDAAFEPAQALKKHKKSTKKPTA